VRSFSKMNWLFCLAAIASFHAGRDAQGADLLTVGSAAPELNVEHWVQNGNGKFKPVTKFAPGKVYVVEFWATWCGPCINSMPHLAALQTEMADKGVQIVSISDEDLETVERFLDRELRGASEADADTPKKTYRDLTSAYCLTTDPDQSSYRDYMEAAAQNGIPTAFIVGKDAKVEWIGHPMEMDGPLAAVVAGSWDRKAFAEEMKAKQQAEKAMQDIFALLQKQEFDAALKLIDETVALSDAPKSENLQLEMLKLQVLIVAEKAEAAAAHLEALYAGLADKPSTVNMVAWNMYEMTAQGRLKKGPLLDKSIAAVEAAIPKTEADQKASALDTLAHLYFVNDNLDKAIEIESEAVKLAGEQEREFIENFLKELLDAKKSPAASADAVTPVK
jgi:thiol-disulfide isomerase/thioredoxin